MNANARFANRFRCEYLFHQRSTECSLFPSEPKVLIFHLLQESRTDFGMFALQNARAVQFEAPQKLGKRNS